MRKSGGKKDEKPENVDKTPAKENEAPPPKSKSIPITAPVIPLQQPPPIVTTGNPPEIRVSVTSLSSVSSESEMFFKRNPFGEAAIKHEALKVKRTSYETKYVKPDDLLPGQIYKDENRMHWEARWNSILSMIGFAVGLSNVYRFPYLCYTYKGINFLIPYFFFVIFVALPVMYLEVIIGQFTQSGMIAVWKICPIFRGVGVCQTLLPVLISFYDTALLAWALLYICNSAVGERVPWVGCNNDWNTLKCRDIPPDFEVVDLQPEEERRAGAEYFRGRVLRRWTSVYAGDFNHTSDNGNASFGLSANDLDDVGFIASNWEMPLYLLAVFIGIWFFLHRGLRTKGQSIWITVTTPYIFMVVLLFRELALPGGSTGIGSLFGHNVNSTVLFNSQTWIAAAEQTFFSTGAGCGIHMTIASYNKFKTDGHLDSIITVIVNSSTSFICGVIVFLALGSIAHSDSSAFDDLIASGPDLIFEVCVDAFGRLPGAPFFCFIFFLMILLLGFECTIESLICAKLAFFEVTGSWFERNGNYKTIFVIGILIICYVIGLFCVSRRGLHVFILLDNYTSGISFQLCAFIFIVSVTWFWGLKEICDASVAMNFSRPSLYYQISWKILSPIVLLVTIITSIVSMNEATYRVNEHVLVKLKDQYQIIGKIYAFVPALAIPIGIVWYFCKSEGKGFKQKLLLGISPNYEHEKILRTESGERAQLRHYLYFMVKGVKRAKVKPASTVPDDNALEQNLQNEEEPNNATEGMGPTINVRPQTLNV